MNLPQFELNAHIEESHWWFCARRHIIETLVRHLLPPAADVSIVDVGCGTGANIAALAEDYSSMGIDPSADAIEFARRRFPHVDFFCGEVPEALGECGSGRHLFLLTDVLEHVPDDRGFLAALVDHLNEGDLLLITVPADMALWSLHDESHGHYLRYDEARLRRVWSELPLKEIMVSHFNARLYPLIRAVREFNRRCGRSFGDAGTDLTLPNLVINRLLYYLMAGESGLLLNQLHHPEQRAYFRGVSMVAVLRCCRESN